MTNYMDKNFWLKLDEEFKQAEVKYRIISINHLSELKDEYNVGLRRNSVDEGIIANAYDDINFNEIPDGTRSVLITSKRNLPLSLSFVIEGKVRTYIVPPTYYHITDQEVDNILVEIYQQFGIKYSKANLPKKYLASRSGLGRYGKNNILYVDGFGSYHRLHALFLSVEPIEDQWQEIEELEMCGKCGLCASYCPTGAIGEDHFVIHAEKCLTFHNESTKTFPEWINPKWHNALIGCMKCQIDCPLNSGLIEVNETRAEFSESESAQILNGISFEELSKITQNKLIKSGLDHEYKYLKQNLSVLI